MRFIIIFITFVFSIISLWAKLPQDKSLNFVSGYALSNLGFIGNHLFLFLLLFLVVSLFVFKAIKFEEKHPKKHHILIIFSQTLFMFIIGIFSSFILLIIIAVIQLNSFAYVVNLSPSLLGVQTDINTINNTLKSQGFIPTVTVSDANYFKELQAISYATSGTNTFYGKYVLSSIPSFMVLPTKKIGSIMLVDKTLIISDVNKKQLEVITPTLTYLFIKNYFQGRPIRHFPSVNIMNSLEYAKFRQQDYASKAALLKLQIENTKNQIASTSSQIEDDQSTISINKDIITSTYAQKYKIYNQCMAKGEYNKTGKFIKSNTKDYCLNQVTSFDKTIKEADDNITLYTKTLDKDINLLKSYKEYAKFFDAESSLIDSLKANIPLELGLYVPSENSLKIVIDPNSPHAVSDYFETVTHEYLHYASHVEGNKTLQVALFEEGITEYFAKNIIEQNFYTNTNLGYPVFVRIIGQIAQVIPETELADYYFSKDQKGLENALNRVYGDNFYKDNLILFQTLQYASDNKQLLGFANKLMNKLGGKILKENDILSSPVN